MTIFYPGDVVECIDGHLPKGPYKVFGMSECQEFVKVIFPEDDRVSGGFFPWRFRLISPGQDNPLYNKPMDSQEYDDILTGDEIYAQLKDGA